MQDVTGAAATDRGTDGAGATHPGLLLVFARPDEGVPRVLVLEGSAVLIGREPPKGGWTIPQTAISRTHATLQKTTAGVRIGDMGSRNGTFVNGRKVVEEVLSDGDIVRTGDAIYRFAADAEAHRAYSAAPRELPHGLVGGLSMSLLAEALASVGRGVASVLLLGETGVGKDVAARLLHEASGRRGRLVAVNCAAIPANLFESQLFGHERGAFTGAVRAQEGLVRSATGGTLFLDEIGDMPTDAQAKLLRVLENREVLPVGATRSVPVDVRVIGATHRDLPELVRRDRFRADLFARISQRTVRLPPLRERKEDLLPLVLHFLRATTRRESALSLGFMQRLALHAWPFNVRELASAVEHAAELAKGDELVASHLPDSVREPPPKPETPAGEEVVARRKAPTAEVLKQLLEREEGNVAAVARALERDPAQVFRWLRQRHIDPEDFR